MSQYRRDATSRKYTRDTDIPKLHVAQQSNATKQLPFRTLLKQNKTATTKCSEKPASVGQHVSKQPSRTERRFHRNVGAPTQMHRRPNISERQHVINHAPHPVGGGARPLACPREFENKYGNKRAEWMLDPRLLGCKLLGESGMTSSSLIRRQCGEATCWLTRTSTWWTASIVVCLRAVCLWVVEWGSYADSQRRQRWVVCNKICKGWRQ